LATSAAVRAEALTGLGDILSNRSDFERAEEHLEEAVALWEELGDQGRLAECFELLGFVAQIRAAHPWMFPKRAIFLRLGQKMSRNTHAFVLPDNAQITPASYSGSRRQENAAQRSEGLQMKGRWRL
jgi:Tetratricopeptide repeat